MVYTATITRFGKRPGKLTRFETVAFVSFVKDKDGNIVLKSSSVPVGRLINKVSIGSVIQIKGSISNNQFGNPIVEVIS